MSSILKPKDIMDTLTTLFQENCPVTEHDIKHPTAEKMLPLYGMILEKILRARLVKQPSARALEKLGDHPYIYEEYMYRLNVSKALQKVGKMCQVPDIDLGDILMPQAKRTFYILGALTNYLRFTHQNDERFYRAQDDLASLRAEKASKERELLSLTEQIAAIRARHQAEEPSVQELRPVVASLQQKLEELVANQAPIHQRYAALKEDVADKSNRLATRQAEIAQLRQCIAEKQAQIVESPEKLLAMNPKEEKEVAELREQLTAADDLNRGIAEHLTILDRLDSELAAREPEIEKIRTRKEAIADMEKKIEELKLRKEERLVHLKELTLQTQRLKDEGELERKRYMRELQQVRMQRDALRHKAQEDDAAEILMQEEEIAARHKEEDVQAMIFALEAERTALRKDHMQKLARLQDDFRQLVAVMKQSFEKTKSAWTR